MRFTLIRTLIAAAASFAALAVLSSTPNAAQAQAAREGVMFVSAVGREGEPVPNLGPEAFQIREDGVKREVLRVSRATEPIDIAILVDNCAAARDAYFKKTARYVSIITDGGMSKGGDVCKALACGAGAVVPRAGGAAATRSTHPMNDTTAGFDAVCCGFAMSWSTRYSG